MSQIGNKPSKESRPCPKTLSSLRCHSFTVFLTLNNLYFKDDFTFMLRYQSRIHAFKRLEHPCHKKVYITSIVYHIGSHAFVLLSCTVTCTHFVSNLWQFLRPDPHDSAYPWHRFAVEALLLTPTREPVQFHTQPIDCRYKKLRTNQGAMGCDSL